MLESKLTLNFINLFIFSILIIKYAIGLSPLILLQLPHSNCKFSKNYYKNPVLVDKNNNILEILKIDQLTNKLEFKKLFNINGLIYCFKYDFFRKYSKIFSIKSRILETSKEISVDIDTLEDFKNAEKISKKRRT